MALRFVRFAGVLLMTFLCYGFASAQKIHYVRGALDVDVFLFHPCGGGPDNGYLKININNAQLGASGSAKILIFGSNAANTAPSQGSQVQVPVGGTFIFDAAKDLPAGTYNLLIVDSDNAGNVVNTFSSGTIPVLIDLAPITITDAPATNLTNTSCSTPNGDIAFNIAGGSQALAGGGSYTYKITSTNSVVGFPLTGTTNGTSTLDVTALLNATNPPISGLPGGTYALTLTDNYSVCGATKTWVITDPSPAVFNTISATPNICLGQPGTVQLSNSETSAVTYEIYKNGVATGITLTGTSGLLNFTIPATLLTPVATYNFTIRASNGFCTPVFMNLSAAIKVNPLPVPTIAGSTPVCQNSTGNIYTTESGKSGYLWSIVGGTIDSGSGTNSVSVTWNTAGAESITVNYMDANGCAANPATTKAITVNPIPVPTITGNASACISSTGNVYQTQSGMTGYTWSVVGGTITSGGTTNTVQVTWNIAGPQTISVNFTDINLCTATAPTVKSVTVNPLPVPTLGGPANVCFNSNAVYSTDPGNSAYVWTVSSGGNITAGLGTSSITVNWNGTGAQTVTVSYTDVNLCTAAAPTSTGVTIHPLPTPSLTGPISVCAGTTGVVYNTDVAQSSYLWSVSSGGTITAGTGTSSITVTWATAGPQTVSVNYQDANLCTSASPTSLNVNVNALPVPTITGNGTVCVGDNGVTYFTESGKTGYLWSVAGGTIATGGGTNTITVNWATSGAQSVSVNYTDVNLCTANSPTVLPVTVNVLPVPTITGNASACLNSTGNVYFTESGNTAYVWTVIGGNITAGAGTNSVTVAWTTTGPQSISVNYKNVNLCTAASPTVLPVTVNALPVPVITGPASACQNATGIVYSTQSGQSSYSWTVTGGNITSGTGTNSITVDWLSAGPGQVTVNFVDGNLCTAATPTVENVTVNPPPVPVITGSASACINSTGNTYSTASGQTGYAWTVSAGGTITSGGGTNIITVTWNATGAQSVSVNYTDINLCSAATPTTKNVTVNPLPVPTITGPNDACLNSSNSYSTETSNTGYVWSITGGSITAGAGTSAVTVTWTATGAQSISVTYTDVNLCAPATPTNFPVNVNPLPVPVITGPATVCANATGIIYSTASGQLGYLWNVTGGSITSGASTNSITVDWTGTGSQTVSVNYFDPVTVCTAASPTNYTVLVNAQPVPTLTGNLNVCLNSTGNTYSTDAGNSSYTWTVSAGGTITSGTGTNTIVVTWSGAGSQTVTVTYIDANLCSPAVPTSKTVNVNNPPVPTISGAATVCSGNTGITYTTEASESAYTWTVSGGTITGGGATNSITVDWPSAGSGNVTVTYTDANLCTPVTPTSFPVTINNSPNSAINPAGPFCSNAGIQTLTAVSPGGTWSGIGIVSTSAGTFDPSVAGAGTVNYSLTSGGCTSTSPLTIVINPAPDATIVDPGAFCISDPAKTLSANTPGGTWSGGSAITAGGVFDPSIAGVGPYPITYSVTSAAGCTDTKNFTLTVSPKPVASITSTGPYCTNDTGITLTGTPAGGTWSGTNTTPAGAFDPSGGSQSVTYTVNVGTCSDSNTATINVNPAPDASIQSTGTGPFCPTDPATNFTPVNTGGTWSGIGITDPVAGTFAPSVAFAGGTSPFVISYMLTGANGCSDTKTVSVVVATPDATIQPIPTQCSNVTSYILVAAGTSGGVWSGAGVSAAGIFNPSAAGIGTATITYTVTIGSCTDTKSTTVQVASCTGGGTNCAAFITTITDVLPSCSKQNDGTININVASSGGVPPYIVQLTSSTTLAKALTGPGPDFSFPNLSPADYTYTITDVAGNTCTLPYTLELQTGITATASNFVDAKCFDGDGSATLTVTSGGTSPYEYSIDAGVTWTTFTSPGVITGLKADPSPYSVLVRDDASDLCSSQVLVTINGPASPLDTLFVNRTISLPDLATGTMVVGIKESGTPPYQARLELITPVFDGQAFVADWTDATRNPEDLKIEIAYKNLFAGVYTLSISDGLGCVRTYSITIGVDTKIFIPNIFTPNNDSFNDTFYIRNLPAGTTVVVSNRWGKEVFSSKDYKNDWTATDIADGMYFYRIKAADQVFTGWLEVLRGAN